MRNTFLLTIEDNEDVPLQSWWLREKLAELLETEADYPGFGGTVTVERNDGVDE
jgi:hypothetical protein